MNRIVRLAVLSTLGLAAFALVQQALPPAYSGAASAQMLPADPHAKAAARAAALDKQARMKKSATNGPGMSVLPKESAGLLHDVPHEPRPGSGSETSDGGREGRQREGRRHQVRQEGECLSRAIAERGTPKVRPRQGPPG